jgi:hypothetical protein
MSAYNKGGSLRAASHGGRTNESSSPKLPIFLAERENSWHHSSSSHHSLDFQSHLTQLLIERRNFWHQNSQKVLPCRHFGGCSPLGDDLPCQGPKDKLLLSTNQIAGIPSPLNLWPSCKVALSI